MARKKTTDQSELFLFPLQGIDLSTGRNEQRSGTTPIGANVRSYDAATLRKRGGSRGGLTPLFGAGSTTQVSGTHVVQHLQQIVWVSRAALLPASTATILTVRIDYSETNNPPVRNAPQKQTPFSWYSDTAPTFPGVSNVIVGTPDGGGTGIGTCSFKISTNGTTVTLVATFVSAGFPGPYFYAGPAQVQTITQSNANFFNPAVSQLAGSWTVVSGSFIAVLPFNVFYPGP